MMLRTQQSITLAPRKAAGASAGEAMRVTILGPDRRAPEEVASRSGTTGCRRTRKRAQDDPQTRRDSDDERLGTSEFDGLLTTLRLQAESFGNPDSVTPPNLASLTLLVEEKGAESIL